MLSGSERRFRDPSFAQPLAWSRFMTTAEMRRPDRPPVVGQAAAVLWTVTALFAAAVAVKTATMTTVNVGTDAQFHVANIHNSDPDLLEYVPIYLGIAEFAVVLCYAYSVLWFALAAHSVARGGRRSLVGTVLASVNVALGLALYPLVWFQLPDHDDVKGQLVKDEIAEHTPLWAWTGDALAVIALLIAVDAIIKLCSKDARWFRGSIS
jgi:hypothetical protein